MSKLLNFGGNRQDVANGQSRPAYLPPSTILLKLARFSMRADGSGTVTMTLETFNKLLECAMRAMPFDERRYLERNPDVGSAMRAGEFSSAFNHLATHGYFEHRALFDFRVDEAWYRKTYPDIADAIAKKTFSSGAEHFREYGYFEGRSPNAELEAEVAYWRDLEARSAAPKQVA